jgi:small subunit ribosomal protein S11
MASPKSKSKAKPRKNKRTVNKGVVHISSTFNNTIVTITDTTGGAISSASAGQVGFKGSKKSTPFAAQLAAESAARKAIDNFSLSEVIVQVSGPGAGRETAARAIQQAGLKIIAIKDVTPLPHNGCRAPGARRV